MFSAEEQSILEKGGLSSPPSLNNEDGATQSVEFPEGGPTGWSVILGAYVVIHHRSPFPVLTLRVHADGYFSSVPTGTYICAEIVKIY